MDGDLSKKAKMVLVILAEGKKLEFLRSPRGYFLIASKGKTPWADFHRKTLLYGINLLYGRQLIDIEETLDGITKITANEAGRQYAIQCGSELGPIERPKEWDRKWRLIFFDIPEDKKRFRDAFRYKIQRMGLKEFQRSAFIFPFPCFREIEALASRLGIKDHVVLVTADSLSNEFVFKNHFGLT